MSLQARLDRIRVGFEKEAPAEALAIMHRATNDLETSGIMNVVYGEGQQAPNFSLDDSLGNSTNLADLRSNGSVVVTFFRGDW